MQNVILANQAVATMTSLELVEFINSQRGDGESELRHDHFMAKVPQVLGGAVAPNFRGYYKASNGKQNPMYTFPKREACLMAMSYSYELQAKVFDRMTELEHKPQHLIPQTLSEALRLAADLSDQRNAAVAQLSIATPKAEALDRIALTDGMFHLQAAGKLLQQPPNKFIQWLREIGWIYKRPGNATNYPHVAKSNAGYLAVKSVTITQQDGTDRTREQTMVTPKGLTKLALMLGVDKNLRDAA